MGMIYIVTSSCWCHLNNYTLHQKERGLFRHRPMVLNTYKHSQRYHWKLNKNVILHVQPLGYSGGGGGGYFHCDLYTMCDRSLSKKHPQHRFYPLLKWHPKQITWVIFDTLNRDFCSCVRFHTLKKEYWMLFLQLFQTLNKDQFFSYPKQGKSIGKNLVTSSDQPGHTRETEKGEGLMISPFIIKLTYLFDLPTLFVYFSM